MLTELTEHAAVEPASRSRVWSIRSTPAPWIPEIPCLPALVLARKLARNEIPQRGAYACLGMMTLLEFEEAVRELDISWEVVE